MTETDWSYDEDYYQLQEEISEIAARSRVEETKKMVKALEVGKSERIPTDFEQNNQLFSYFCLEIVRESSK